MDYGEQNNVSRVYKGGMMEFNEQTHKVDIDTLSKDEALAFVMFLNDERTRHYDTIVDCEYITKHPDLYSAATVLFYDSAVKRHFMDIDEITGLIAVVKEKFGL